MKPEIDYSLLDGYKNNFNKYALQGFGAIIAIFFVSLMFGLFVSEGAVLSLFILVGVAVVALWGYIFYQRSEERRHALLLVFAVKNGFVFEKKPANYTGPATLFTHGHSQTVTDMIRGTLGDLPFFFYRFDYATGSGKNRRTYDAMVMEIVLPRKLPHMVIDSHVEGDNEGSTLPIHFDKSQKLELEGDFYQYFSLYAPDTYGVTALTIIAPDVMQTLVRHAALCDMEIIDDRLYFYWPEVCATKQDFIDKFETTSEVLKETKQKLTKSDIFAQKSQAQVHTQPGAGVRLKKTYTTEIVFAILFGLFYFLSFFAEVNETIGNLLTFTMVGFIFGIAIFHSRATKKRERLKKQLVERYGAKT